jgi:adenosylhomocysteine nucleosidase
VDSIKKSGSSKILTMVALPIEISMENWGSRPRIIYSGVGKINASIILVEAIQIFKPDLVVNLGTAGSIRSEIEGVVEVDTVLERDFDAFPLCDRGLIPFEAGDNRYCSGYEGVICASGDSFVRESDNYLKSMNVDIVDMELIAIARVCNKYNIPWRSFKFISDYIGRNTDKQWQDGVTEASKALIDKFDSEFFRMRM